MNLFIKNSVTCLFILAWLAATATVSAKCPGRRTRNNRRSIRGYCRKRLHDPKKPRIDTKCQQDSDCSKKDVGNCCGYFPKCVNKDFEPNLEAMKLWCQVNGSVGVCGWADFDSCQCQEGVCEEVQAPQICTADAYECPDGKFVPRSGPNCEFNCGTCTKDAYECPDGRVVVREGPLCEFNCGPCTEEIEQCENGSGPTVREPPLCNFICACDEDVHTCPNGRVVGREGLDCEFNCGPCTEDAFECPNGKVVGREGPKCEFDCGPCTEDAFECPDGRFVGRQGPKCEFDCGPCTKELEITCKDGSSVGRVPPLCDFAKCPLDEGK